ncbi:MAG: lamin tail domain-containing protein [Parcubacteria group bacterium]|nr:lamin tail domain-containing protein [Parcubacteria group bacterium]
MSFKTLLFILYFLSPTTTYAIGTLIINELMYNPDGSDLKREWVEIKNTSLSPITIKDWRINDGTNHQIKNDAHPDYFTILPNEFVIFASDITTFLSEHIGFGEKVFDTVLDLKNTNGHVTLLDNNKTIIDDITYQSSSGADGNGKTLERLSNTSAEFHESSLVGGTPGKENGSTSSPQAGSAPPTTSTPTQNSTPITITLPHEVQPPKIDVIQATTTPSSSPRFGVVISEFLPNPSKDKEEWIELKNTNDATTTLTGWHLKDGSSHEYTLKDISLAPNAFLVIFQHDSKIHINNDGDELSLTNSKNDLVSKIMFQSKAPQNKSFARRGENDWAWTSQLTPGETNIIVSPPSSIKQTTTKELADISYSPTSTPKTFPPLFPNTLSTPLLSTLAGLMFTIITIIFIKKFL